MKKVLLVIILAFILRVLWLPDNFFFGYEQGRDMLAIKSIVAGNLSLIGPWTSIPGFFHGALSYWLITPLYILGGGNPLFIIIVEIFINVLSLLFFYKATEELFGKKAAAFSLLLISVSFISIVYARWFSNPTLVPAFLSVLYYSLVKAKKVSRYLILSSFSFAVIFHLQAIVAVSLIPAILVTLIALKIKVTGKVLILSLGVFLFMLSTYFVFDIRHDFLMFNGLKDFLFSSGGDGRVGLVEIWTQFREEAEGAFFYGNRALTIGLLLFLVLSSFYLIKRNKNIVILWAFALSTPVFFYVVGIRPLDHYLMAVHFFLPIILGFSLASSKKFSLLALAILGIVVFGNLKAVVTRLPENVGIFLYAAQRNYLGDITNLIDYIYSESEGDEFSYDYYSIPYWHNDAWQYMFLWYGKGRYGKLPVENRTDTFYVLIEPDETQPKYQEDWYKKLNETSSMLEVYESGKLKVEKRKQI